MKIRLKFTAFFLALLSAEAHASDDAMNNHIPTWLLGDWVVTKIYEDKTVYPEADREPQVWLGGKTMKIETGKLSLGGEICLDLDVAMKHGNARKVFVTELGKPPENIGVKLSNTAIDYLRVTCGKSFTDETFERDEGLKLDWNIFLKSKDQIEMPFFGGAYLELRRTAPTS